ncbi:CoA-binding protein [Flavobacterium litorale]|uniref:CoA-binding protein n=1 Tax=Flavobacterium litorale TaxID=2856519 RepID=A0ABX8V390_9FLAO|nr:CoA-binding protein [Flavobacterium litorale]QYJ67282.1 CoA-binding protein [Flavobacterium litorale]
MSTTKKTLVMGASTAPDRYANKAIKMLQQYNQPVVAIGKKEGNVDGITIEKEQVPFEGVDTVTLYLNPVRQKPYYNYIISLQPKRVVFNPGTENPEFYKLLQENNIMVDVGCTLVMLTTNQY